jgi:hypothetical protein
MAEAKYVTADSTSMCLTGMRPIVLDDMILSLIRDRFADASEFPYPYWDKYVWNEDPTQSTISIEDAETWITSRVEKRPAIITKQGILQPNKIGIGDMLQGTFGKQEGTSYMRMYVGTHAVFAISGLPKEARELGYYVWDEISKFAPIIAQDLLLLRIEVGELQSTYILEESTQHFVVPFGITYAYTEQWTLRREAPPLKTLELNTQFETSEE